MGLDYYTDTVFEYVTSDLAEGREVAIFAGGRYDNLFEFMGGNSHKAVGGAIGIDRVMQLYDMKVSSIDVYLVSDFGLNIASTLREKGISVLYEGSLTLKKGLKRADKLGADLVIIFQEEERETGQIKIKNMKTGDQESILISCVVEYVVQKIKNC